MSDSLFSPDMFPLAPRSEVSEAMGKAWSDISGPGAWLTGEERVQVAELSRRARPRCIGERRPEPRDLEHPGAEGQLSCLEVEVVQRVAGEAWTLSRGWFDRVTERLSIGRYAEIVAVIATIVPIDRFCDLLDRPRVPLLEPLPGKPSLAYPDNVKDQGAWVPVEAPWEGANIARALSVVPQDNRMRLSLVRTMYSRPGAFNEMSWAEWPLTRSQVELLAARTSALNECFY